MLEDEMQFPKIQDESAVSARAPIPAKIGAALVTGSAKRIGKALALMLAGEGMPVVIHHHHSADAAAATAAMITDAGGRAIALTADLCDAAATQALMARATDAIGAPIACLINNASIFKNDAPETFQAVAFDQNMAIHARAPALLSQAMAALLPAHMHGVIINMLDQKSFNPDPSFFSYAISKYALLGLTETLARALAPRIRVNGIALGLTLPPPQMSEARFTELHTRPPLGRGAEVADVVAAARYLIHAPKVTGDILRVDGGEHMGFKN